jgi:hypothetical protein
MDNCSVQNKNNHVLHLADYPVEMKLFRSIEFIFYVRGHTKNSHNQMKIRYHKDQVPSYRVALNVLNSQPNITTIDATEENMFKNYGKMLTTFYCNFEPGTKRVNHFLKLRTWTAIWKSSSLHMMAPLV